MPISRPFTNVKLCLLVAVFVCFSTTALCAANLNESAAHKNSESHAIILTPKEKKWLAAHKTIRIGYDGSLPPYSFINDQGRIDGIAVEIMAILSQRIGAEFKIHPDYNWSSLYRAAAGKKVDIIAAMVARPDRVKWFNFTKPYLTKSLVIVTRKDNLTISSRGDLANMRVAVVKGYRYVDQIGAEFPTAKTVKFDSMLDSLKKVESGDMDASILFLGTANFLQAKYQLKQLKIAAFFERNSADESIAVRKDWPILVGILQKGLDSLTDQEVEKIFSKWVVQGGVEVEDNANTAAKTAAEKAAAGAAPAQVTKKLVEIEQKPGVFNDAPKAIEKPAQEAFHISKMLVIFLVVLALFLLWLTLNREMKKRRHKARNEMIASGRHLQSDKNEGMHLTIEPVPVDSDIAEKPILDLNRGADIARAAAPKSAQEPVGSPPITLNPQKLAQEKKQPEILSNEQIQYQRDENGDFSFISHTITYVLGYSEADFMANYRDYLTNNPVNQKFHGVVETFIQGQPEKACEIEIFDAGGDIHWLLVSGSAIYDGLGHCIGVQGTMSDITNEKLFGKITIKEAETEQVIKSNLPQSFHDSLQEAIRWADKGGNPFSVVFLSLERLRFLDGGQVNFQPDEVLKEASKRLRSTLRDSDTVVEMDVDKFALILPETNEKTAHLIGEKIRKILQVPYLVGVQSIVLDTAMGFAAYPSHGSSPEALIKKAQVTAPLSPVKPSETKKPAAENLSEDASLQLQQDLVYALDECKVALRASSQNNVNALSRHSQFAIHYQSRHNLSDYSINGFEALIRWRHPELGMLLPRDFVNLVKDIGLLDVMTYWIIQQVSFQALDWEAKGIRPGLLAVNLGDLNNKQAVEVKKIAAIVNEAGAKPEWLMFSILASDLASQPDLVTPFVGQLVAAGFSVGIDNFDSEHTIEALKSLPVQVVEIDPALVRYVPGNSDHQENVTRCISALHVLGKTIVAKEVESEKQLDFLKTCGCDVIQGHLLSRPLPAKEAKELMENLPDFAWYLKQ